MGTPMVAPCVVMCTRCGLQGHKAACCSKPFLRSLCPVCDRMGHTADTCPQKRRAEYLERKAKKMDDACSEASDLTSSTAATRSGTAISKPSESIAAGEQVDPKQLEKTKRKVDIDQTVVM